ncbi:hypothetical protein Tco_0862051, partial [Tanacetum coccineum]
DFQENSDDEADERTSEEYLRDLALGSVPNRFILQEIAFLKRLNKSPSSYSSSVSKCFQLKFTPKLIQSSQHTLSSQVKPKAQKDYKTKYKKLKAKLALFEASSPTSQSSKPFQSKNKGSVAKTFDWDEEEVSDDDRDQSSSTNGLIRCVNSQWEKNVLTMVNGLDITIKKVNIILSMDEDSDCEKILNQKKKVLGGEQLTETSSKNDAKDNPFVPASLDYDYEMVPKSKDWVESLNPESKLLNFNTGRILVPKSEAVNEYLQLTEGAFPSSEVMTLTYQDHFLRERSGLGTMKHTKPETQESSNKNVSGPVTVSNPDPVTSSVPTEVKTNDQESKINKLTKLVQMLMDEKINSTQKPQELIYVSSQPESSKSVNSSKQSQDSKPNGKNPDSSKPVRPKPFQKPKLKCKLCNYTNHSTDDCYRILYCIKCKREDHRTSDHDMYIASLKSSQNYKA